MLSMDLTDLFDGEMHQLKPGEDWWPVERVIVEWVETDGQPEFGELEDPEFNWVVADLSENQQRYYGVEGGWAHIATHLRWLAEAMGGTAKVYQKGKTYWFQFQEGT